ncbi:hypothetical protein GGR57DRAFT_280184 [Xylariaceae sp. FL1272]|nr:hypothetical protein GGR57DRAFT_280184 [Xylariaceae sp. FL1272]
MERQRVSYCDILGVALCELSRGITYHFALAGEQYQVAVTALAHGPGGWRGEAVSEAYWIAMMILGYHSRRSDFRETCSRLTGRRQSGQWKWEWWSWLQTQFLWTSSGVGDERKHSSALGPCDSEMELCWALALAAVVPKSWVDPRNQSTLGTSLRLQRGRCQFLPCCLCRTANLANPTNAHGPRFSNSPHVISIIHWQLTLVTYSDACRASSEILSQTPAASPEPCICIIPMLYITNSFHMANQGPSHPTINRYSVNLRAS